MHRKVVVIGSGPAGLTAALYAARANLEPLVIRGLQPGGLIATTNEVENYPGFPEVVGGFDLAQKMEDQAARFGAEYMDAIVEQVDFTQRPFRLTTDRGEIVTAETVIISTGASPRHLGVPGEEQLANRGVSYCATCDGFFFRGKKVVVVGGGNSALDEGLFLTRYVDELVIIHRRDALARLPDLAEGLASAGEGAFAGAARALAVPPELAVRLRSALVDEPPALAKEGGIIREGFDEVRDSLHALAHSGKRWIAELEAAERERTGIPSLKVGYNKVFGYYLEITNAHRDKAPADYERRQTLTNAERYVTPALKAREAEVLGAEDKLRAREHELFVALREETSRHVASLQSAADALARLDAESALAEAAARYEWTRPALEDSDRLLAEGARHPVVERLLPRGEFVTNDVRLDARDRQILLLTGPNMGGKSTYLRQVALLVLLAQSGSWVPAARATIGLVDRLFTRVGAADRLGAGQSTFMVEMRETADILTSATARSLVLLDEIGRGTATYDGLALAWAVTEHLHAAHGPRPRTIFATHYHELTQLAEKLPRLANAHVTVKEWGDGVVFLHRLADGPADRSYGIHVARLAGLPPSVIERAKVVLMELESERTVEELEKAPSRRARRASSESLPLFESASPTEHPLEGELKALAPDAMTPLEALQKLAEWKRRFGA